MDTPNLDGLTEKVIGAFYQVANTLGSGFLEKVYERALVQELRYRGLDAQPQVPYVIKYREVPVGEYFADILINNQLIIELKCVDRLNNEHKAQCLNYLTASNLPLCLLVNFQHAKVEFHRIIKPAHQNDQRRSETIRTQP